MAHLLTPTPNRPGASVVIDDDPRFYGSPRSELWRVAGKDGPRLAAIRRAASLEDVFVRLTGEEAE